MLLFPLHEFLSISLHISYRIFCCHFVFVFLSFVCFSWTSSGLFLFLAYFFSLFLSLCHCFYVPVCLFNFFLFKENIFCFVTLLPSIAGHLNILVFFCLTTFLSILLPIVSLPFSLSICLSECLSVYQPVFWVFFSVFLSVYLWLCDFWAIYNNIFSHLFIKARKSYITELEKALKMTY